MKTALFVLVVLTSTLLIAQIVVPATAPGLRELQQKAANGDAEAQLTLARAYQNGEGVPQNDELAVKWYRAAAEQGNAAAQNSLGVMYRMGHGVEKDFEQARQWYLKAAKQKLGAALFNLGTLYYNGDGVTVNDERAYAYFALAKDAGSTEGAEAALRMEAEFGPAKLTSARLFLADFLDREQGEPQRALKLYEAMAAVGNQISQVRAARMYLDGKGTPRDVSRARDYCEAAANEHFTPGMVCLGYLYQTGQFGTADFKTALSWYEKAASTGNPVAMYSLGVMYAKGSGVKEDNTKAYAYFAKAALGRIPLAAAALQALGPKLTKGQLRDASRQALGVFVLPIDLYPEIGEFGRALKLD